MFDEPNKVIYSGLILLGLVAMIRHRGFVEIRFPFCRVVLRDTPPEEPTKPPTTEKN